MNQQVKTWGPRVIEDPYFTSSPWEPELPSAESIDDVDVTDPDLYLRGDPHASWKLLREKAPIVWHEKGAAGTGDSGFWAVGGHEGFFKVLQDTDNFTSTAGPFLDVPGELFGEAFVMLDPPQLTAYRRGVQRHLTTKAVAQTERIIRELIVDSLERVLGHGTCNFARDVADDFPPAVISGFLGLTAEETERVRQMNVLVHAGSSAEHIEAYTTYALQLIDDLLSSRARNPSDDMFGALLADEKAGVFTRAQTVNFFWILFLASLDGPVNSASLSMIALMHHPEQFEVLKARRDVIDNGVAVEELLRFVGNSYHLTRRAKHDTEVFGQRVEAGQDVAVFQVSANRDATVFEDPFRLDVTKRRNAPIAAFGAGPHACLGQNYARFVLKIFLQEFVARFRDVEQAGPVVRRPHFTVMLSPIDEFKITYRAA